MPVSVRFCGWPFLGLSCAPATPAHSSATNNTVNGRMNAEELLPPIVFSFLLLVLHEGLIIFLFFFLFFGRYQFQRFGTRDAQAGAALVATNRVALVDVFFVYIDHAVACRAFNPVIVDRHSIPPKILLINDTSPFWQAMLPARAVFFHFPACLAKRRRVV